MGTELVLKILDLFLISGWKAIILASVSILTIANDKLMLIQECDEVISFFTTLEFKSSISANNLFAIYYSLEIYDDMLYDWEKMYVAKAESV